MNLPWYQFSVKVVISRLYHSVQALVYERQMFILHCTARIICFRDHKYGIAVILMRFNNWIIAFIFLVSLSLIQIANIYQVKKIVQGQFSLFRAMYKPFLEEYATRDLLRLSSSGDAQVNIFQVCPNSSACFLIYSML